MKRKRILITGKNSYIGTSFEKWLQQFPDDYQVDTLDMEKEEWKVYDFSSYNVVFHVAGIAHVDIDKVTEDQKKVYYAVNTDLAVAAAKKAKEQGVSQFIFMSSMIIYEGCKNHAYITKNTRPQPANFYGDSKWQADKKIRGLQDESFRVVTLRPPMVYGKGSKGNYPELAKLAKKMRVFPVVKNQRSMLHIDNLCQFVKVMIDYQEAGIFYPQNGTYTNTSEMVRLIAKVVHHPITMIPFMNTPVHLLGHFPGKVGKLAQKAFGNSVYEMGMSNYKENYRVCDLEQSIWRTEGNDT